MEFFGHGNPVVAEASDWYGIAMLVRQYQEIVRDTPGGEFMVFGYSTSIPNNAGYKPIRVDEHVYVEGRQVTMGVYAVGPYEFRGTVRAQDDGTVIHTVGMYSTLMDGGRAEGVNIVVEDSAETLAYLFEREFGKLPNGVTFREMAESDMIQLAPRLRDAGESQLYKLQIINVHTANGVKPALAVSVNEKSRFAALDENIETIAAAIIEGHGEVRDNGQPGKRFGGSCLQDFVKLMSIYREKGYHQPRMEEIAGKVYSMASERYTRARLDAMPLQCAIACSHVRHTITSILDARRTETGVRRKRFTVGEQMADRGPVPPERLRETGIPHTVAMQLQWLVNLVNDGGLNPIKAFAAR